MDLNQIIESYINEIRIGTYEWERSNPGKTPKGRGGWGFLLPVNIKDSDVKAAYNGKKYISTHNNGDELVVFTGSSTFKEAKKTITQICKVLGVEEIEVAP